MLWVSLYPSTIWKEFLRSAKTYSFCFSKEERFRISEVCITSNFSFLKQSFIEPHIIISEVCFNNREFHSLFFLSFFVSFFVSFWIFCPPFYVSCPLFLSTFGVFCLLYWVSLHLFCLHFRYNVHHLNYLAYHFYCFRVNSKF